IFAGNGISARISSSYVTTPMLSYAVVKNNADLGIMITASHNPYYYNGYKIKGSYGGSATPDIVSEIEKKVNALNSVRDPGLYLNNAETNNEQGYKDVSKLDLVPDYKKYILNLVDTDVIKGFKFPLLIDPMYGAGQAIYKDILQSLDPLEVHEIHSNINTSFGGINPEPIGDNLNEAISALKEKHCKLAICLDGDGDRIGAIGEEGNFVSSHHIFAIVLNYLVRDKKLYGKVVKTFTTSSIIDRICAKYGLELITTPVGFKYISEEILSGGVIMGGEESGGLWSSGYIPERDGMLIGLLLLEILCRQHKTVNDILADIYNEFGYFVYRRQDYGTNPYKKEKLNKLLSSRIPELLKNEGAREPVTVDGYKYFLDDGSWLMIRVSGTEAVTRVYVESSSDQRLDYLHKLGKKLLSDLN
ncbi:MAG: phosphoglucomutase/phosphomannomutase family protein, partial [Actinobacteria bacterium]|nr:phosphoglucomutase/phosphomannomutase family protein [Actinomycetota bacterium]